MKAQRKKTIKFNKNLQYFTTNEFSKSQKIKKKLSKFNSLHYRCNQEEAKIVIILVLLILRNSSSIFHNRH